MFCQYGHYTECHYPKSCEQARCSHYITNLSEELLDLGSCCTCGNKGPAVRNVIMLPKLAPERGKGWGCVICDLPSDGASAVLCDACMEAYHAGRVKLKYAISGYPQDDVRVPIEMLKGKFDHDVAMHHQYEAEMSQATGYP